MINIIEQDEIEKGNDKINKLNILVIEKKSIDENNMDNFGFTDKKECRYCLSGDKKENMINPCQCEGTMKYVHQQCLEDWIKNRNQTIPEKNSATNEKIFSTPCEICKSQMRFTKYFKNNLMKSILKMLKNIFGSFKSIINFSLNSVIVFYLIKRMRMLIDEYMNLFKNFFNLINPSFWINFIHNITVLTSILVAMNDIISFYSKMFLSKRKCVTYFLPRVEK
jgi:hypothetical protein